MHAAVARRMNLSGFGRIDHDSRNPLDNRRRNLRVATRAQNRINSGPNVNNTSGFKGVSWNKSKQRWGAQIMVAGHTHYLGYFDTKIEAAKAYNNSALQYFGEFAYVNEV